MTAQNLMVIFAVAASNMAVAGIWLARPAVVAAMLRVLARHRAWLIATLVVVPVSLWVAIFVVHGFPVSGDVVAFYRPQGRAAMAGQIPIADFRSSYMPLFPYMVGLVDRAWSNDLSIPLFITVCYAALQVLWLQALSVGGTTANMSARLSLVACLNGAMWFLGIGYQQDEILLALFVASAILLTLQGRERTAGAMLGLGCLGTKTLLAVAAVGVVCASRRRLSMLAGMAATVVPVTALFVWLGWSPLEMMRAEARSLQPPSLTVLAAAVPGIYQEVRSHLWIAQAAIVVWLAAMLVWCRPRIGVTPLEALAAGVAAAWLVFLLLSPKSLSSYRLVILPFVPLLVPARARFVALFVLYSTAVGVQYMLYEDWVYQPYALFLARDGIGAAAYARVATLVSLDLIIVASEMTWLALALRRLRLGRQRAALVASPAAASA